MQIHKRVTSVLFLGKIVLVDTVRFGELIFKRALHAPDLQHSLAVAVQRWEDGGSQLTQNFVNVAQLPV